MSDNYVCLLNAAGISCEKPFVGTRTVLDGTVPLTLRPLGGGNWCCPFLQRCNPNLTYFLYLKHLNWCFVPFYNFSEPSSLKKIPYCRIAFLMLRILSVGGKNKDLCSSDSGLSAGPE